MSRRVAILSLAFLVLPLLTWGVPPDRQKQWQKVQQAMDKGLPKTAIEHIEPIIAAALKDKAYPEYIKAITRKISLEGNIQGNKPEEKVIRLEAAIAKAPAEIHPVMDAILANWYWHYFQQNSWRFLQRTATGEAPGKDFTTWDLPRLFAEIDKQFTKALSAEKALKAIPIAQYNDLLEKGDVPDGYRPTLYDFLAYNALAFYSSGAQGGARAQDAYELPADSPIFASADEFLKWSPKTTDTDSRTVKAIRLYQDLLRFHQGDKDNTAFLDADLWRLTFGYNQAFGEEKAKRYKAALQRLADANPKHEVGVRALFHWASVLHTEGDWVQAHKLAVRGSKALPDSHGGKLCFNLVQTIEAKSFNINTERVWNDPWPSLQVNYRNINKIHFRAVPVNFEQRLKAANWRPEQLNRQERDALVRDKPALEWSADLPATQDYHDRNETLAAPKDLKPGFYFLLASHDPKFGGGDNVVTFTPIWVSQLALVMRQRQGEGSLEGFVLDAKTGQPIEGATVRAWHLQNNNVRVPTDPTQSDVNGYFRFDGAINRTYLVHARHKDQQLHTAHDFYVHRYDARPQPFTQTIFFTDRSLYRPGQTIQYQGLCISVEQHSDSYKALARQGLTVVLTDPNGKEVARRQHQANDYGSFSGSFTAPADRLMGQMHLRVEGQPQGAANVSVEEYKRPKFQVTLEKPKVPSKLNEVVNLQGKATAYTGAAIDGAKVRYRIVREVRYPAWYGWRYWWRVPQRQPGQEIAHGFAATGVDGSFKIDFTAHPDVKVPAKDEPIFHYTVSADVTDTTGETRSGQTAINVGYTALQASLTAADWQTKAKAVEISARTTTLDGEAQEAQGTVKVYRLKQPEKVHRGKLQDHYYGSRQLWRGGKLVEEEPAPDLSNPNSWPLGDVAATQEFKTDKSGNVKISFQLGVGAYRVMLETKDRYGKQVTARLPLRVLDPEAKQLGLKVPNLVNAPKWTVEPGDTFSLLWGTGYDQARAFIEIEHRRKMLKSFWTEPGQTQVSVNQAITEAMRGGFTVRVTMVRENRAYLEARHVDVPWTNKDLKVRWERFVSKLEPGQKETWTAVVTGPDAKRAVAEMVATLYDESLDAYLPHRWQQKINVFRQDHSNLFSQFQNVPVALHHLSGQWATSYKQTTWNYRTFPHDIGGNFWGYAYFEGGQPMMFGGGMPGAVATNNVLAAKGMKKDEGKEAAADMALGGFGGEKQAQAPPPAQGGLQQAPDLSKVSARKNLNETAFFFPQMLASKDGEVK
ncbi:MAG TPA: MG2 domain-containing protein, partial [Gemmataceae bacterium]|nr:MG2 domain-containing protein [Gemmataceae bacterium]